ncbi:MAG: MraY family glycosyltransferase [Acidobacteriaceae bacterium]
MSGPASGRHVHTLPIPRLGGVGIFLSLALVSGIPVLSGWKFPFVITSLVPAGWMFAVGLIDDLYEVRAWRKLLAQVIAGAGLFVLGIRIPAGSGQAAFLISFCATVLWTVVVTNAINLIDGLDGLASGSVLCTIAAMLVAALVYRQHDTAILAAALAGAVLGFLRFNISPATIFLGDSGSLTLGAVIAAISIRLTQVSNVAWIFCLLALAHPLAEVVVSSTRRVLTASPVFRPDRRHMHHRLMDRNLTRGESTATLIALSLIFSFLAVLALGNGLCIVLALVLGLLVGVYSMRAFRYYEFELARRAVGKVLDQRYSIDAHVRLREVAGLLESAPSSSISDMRRLLGESFRGMGFAAVVLNVPEVDGEQQLDPLRKGIQLEFPLNSRLEHLGSLHLRWDLSCAIPLDLTLFSAEFLPVLTRSVQWHVHEYRQTGIASTRTVQRKAPGPRLVPVLRESEPVGLQ